jgi:polyisoprenoid-binding protein YceI
MAWEIDTAHAQIEFAVKHMMISTVKGQFGKLSGTFHLDEQNIPASRIEIAIDAASINTHQDFRDNHLRSADFLDVEQYPILTFKSTRVEQTGPEHAKVTGDLTIKGVTHPVTLDVTLEGDITDMKGQRRQAYSATTTISRKEWGLEWNVALESGGWLVGDTIKVAIETEVFVPAEAPVATR